MINNQQNLEDEKVVIEEKISNETNMKNGIIVLFKKKADIANKILQISNFDYYKYFVQPSNQDNVKIFKNNNFLFIRLIVNGVCYMCLYDINYIKEKCSIKIKTENYKQYVLKDIFKGINSKDENSGLFYNRSNNNNNIILSFNLEDKDTIKAKEGEIQEKIKINIELYKLDSNNSFPDLSETENFNKYVILKPNNILDNIN